MLSRGLKDTKEGNRGERLNSREGPLVWGLGFSPFHFQAKSGVVLSTSWEQMIRSGRA